MVSRRQAEDTEEDAPEEQGVAVDAQEIDLGQVGQLEAGFAAGVRGFLSVGYSGSGEQERDG